MRVVNLGTLSCIVLSLGCSTAFAQTKSSADRDTTIQTSGPNGKSGAMGPNDNPNGSDKDGTKTPPAPRAKTRRAAPTANTMGGPH